VIPRPSVTWVVGSRGLLGGAVCRELAMHGRSSQREVIRWEDAAQARADLRAGIARMLDSAGGGDWNVAWCAGAAVVGSTDASLAHDLDVIDGFFADLTEIATAAGPSTLGHGAVFFASSAGGVYAGSSRPPYDERTVPVTLSPYGAAKLDQESVVNAFSTRTGVPVLIGRVSNLYGPGQNLAKPQGLVSQVCRAYWSGQPVSVYVSMDTLRDYLFVDDAAGMIVAGLDGIRDRTAALDPGTPTGRVVVKVMASQQATSIAALVGEFRRVLKRSTRMVFRASTRSSAQARDLRLRSVEWPELDRFVRTPMPVGIRRTIDAVGKELLAARTVVSRPDV
jgi:UDP-glucose 4-epimerase